MRDRLERGVQALTLTARQAPDLHGVARRNTLRDVVNLLPEDQVEKYRLRVDQCIEIGFATEA